MKRANLSNAYRPQRGGGAGGSLFVGAQVTKWLLIALVGFFLADFVGTKNSGGRLIPHFALDGDALHEVWRWVTYPLVNLQLGSWFFTLITFFVFGKVAEQGIGSRRFAVLLIFTTLVGAAVYALMSAGGGGSLPLTGASGLAVALLVAVAMMYPEQQVQLLIPPIPVKLKTLVFVLVGLMVVLAIAQRSDPAVSLAQLSAVGVSFLCMKNQHWLNMGENLGINKPFKAAGKKKRATPKDTKRGSGMKARTTLNMSVSKREAEVNRILDKVSAEGIGNLTEDEREILKFASKK